MKFRKTTFVLFVVAMLAMAFSDNVRGVFVPSFKIAYDLSNTGIGVLLLASSLMYMISSFYSGKAIHYYNHQKVLLFGSVASTLGLLSIALSQNTPLFFGGMLLLNAGVAGIAISVNTTVPLLDVKHKAVLMNGIHFLYGIGATFAQKSTGALLGMGISFKTIYLGLAVIFILLALITRWLPILRGTSAIKEKTIFTAHQKKLLFVFSIALGLYIAGELQTANWLVSYLKTQFGMVEASAANVSALFFLVFSLGRLVGGFVVQRFGYMKSLIVSLSVACLMYLVGLIIGLEGAWLIAGSGLFFAIVYPTAMLIIAECFKESVAQAAGIVITVSSGVNMLMGLLIGYFADELSIFNAMFMMPLCLFLSIVFFIWFWVDSKSEYKKSTSV